VIPASLDWQRVQKLAKWHQVRPLLFERIQSIPDQIPEKHYNALREFSFGQAVTNMAFLGISTRLLTELKNAGVPVFPMKGALWAWMLYAKPTLREFGDIDYFIEKTGVTKSLEVLRKNGFAPDTYRSFLFSAKNGADAYLDTDYQLPLTPITENALQSLEIQWNCSYPRYYFDFGYADLMRQSIDYQIGNNTLKVPAPEHQLLMMIIHHAGVEQWDKLKYIGDLVRLLDLYAAKMDWSYVRKLAAYRGFENLITNALGLASLLTGLDYNQYAGTSRSLTWESPFVKEIMQHWPFARTSSADTSYIR